jgi:hypothetical protein
LSRRHGCPEICHYRKAPGKEHTKQEGSQEQTGLSQTSFEKISVMHYLKSFFHYVITKKVIINMDQDMQKKIVFTSSSIFSSC